MNFSIVIHGGAGSVKKSETTPQQEQDYHHGLQEALEAGCKLLESGKSALEAVEAAVSALEDNPLFNAGRGSEFTASGTHEMDAAVMCGKTLNAGAVSAVTGVRNPIQLARHVLEASESVFLTGSGAMDFARQKNLPFEEDTYFYTEKRYKEWQEAKEQEAKTVVKDTVGAVAMDIYGNLATATSTGGLANKISGRVGDTPSIGAGTYANNATCAVSCTGDGEYFIRLVSAYDLSCLIEYKGLTLAEACNLVIKEKLTALGGEGGLIAIDRHGNLQMVSNCESMLRAWRDSSGLRGSAIWDNQ